MRTERLFGGVPLTARKIVWGDSSTGQREVMLERALHAAREIV